MKKGICYGVSVGPGAPELITLEAIRIINEVDIIFLPSFPKEDCKAYQIIKRIMPEIDEKDLRAETFIMSREASVANKRHDEIFEGIKPILEDGKNIAFLTLGEVGLYSTYLYIHERLINAGYESVLINGISSVQAIAAKLSISLAIGTDEVHIFPNANNLEAKLMMSGTRVFMKPKGSLEEMVAAVQNFIAKNPGCRAVGISNCGMPEEIIAYSADELSKLNGYFTVIIVTGDMSEYDSCSGYFENRGCKYYPCHKGIEHMNCMFCYCPMYRFENCLGNPRYIERETGRIKDCSACTYPHEKEHYPKVIEFLKNQ